MLALGDLQPEDPLKVELQKAKERMSPSKSYPGVDFVPCTLVPSLCWQVATRGTEYRDRDDNSVWFLDLEGSLWAVVGPYLNFYHDRDAWTRAAAALALRSKGADVV